MIKLNPEDVINLLISNLDKITNYFQKVNLSFENWTNNRMVFKNYRPHIAGLSTNKVIYNKAQLKYLGKLANGMNYNEIVNNADKYGLRDIDIYFIGDLMAARIVFDIYQKIKTINEYRTTDAGDPAAADYVCFCIPSICIVYSCSKIFRACRRSVCVPASSALITNCSRAPQPTRAAPSLDTCGT